MTESSLNCNEFVNYNSEEQKCQKAAEVNQALIPHVHFSTREGVREPASWHSDTGTKCVTNILQGVGAKA